MAKKRTKKEEMLTEAKSKLTTTSRNKDTGVVLSKRECEMLLLLSNGQTSEEISVKENISPHTVETHRGNILRKLKASNITEAVAVALRNKLID